MTDDTTHQDDTAAFVKQMWEPSAEPPPAPKCEWIPWYTTMAGGNQVYGYSTQCGRDHEILTEGGDAKYCFCPYCGMQITGDRHENPPKKRGD